MPSLPEWANFRVNQGDERIFAGWCATRWCATQWRVATWPGTKCRETKWLGIKTRGTKWHASWNSSRNGQTCSRKVKKLTTASPPPPSVNTISSIIEYPLSGEIVYIPENFRIRSDKNSNNTRRPQTIPMMHNTFCIRCILNDAYHGQNCRRYFASIIQALLLSRPATGKSDHSAK